MSKNNTGICAICGENKVLSFEHIPPKKAFNSNPIFKKNYDNLFNKNSYYYNKQTKLNQGFGDYTLCISCNNNTGDWYGKDYIEWAYQGMNTLFNHKGEREILCEFNFKPLNVLKQIISFFLSADKAGVYRSDKDLIKFILDKNNNILPNKYSVFMYLNHSNVKRFIGYSLVDDGRFSKPCHWAEVSFPPFGFLFCVDSPSSHPKQFDITFFKKCTYNENELYRIPLYYLETPDLNIGMYV